MKRNLSFILICSMALVVASCSKQEYYNIPLDANGKAIITQIATGSNTGITTLDGSVTVTTKLPNAKVGDSFTATIVKSQVPPAGGAAQNLPLAGSSKTVTVASDLTTSVTYTTAETQLSLGESIVVTFAGATDSYTTPQITLKNAIAVGNLNFGGVGTAAIRGAGTATLPITVKPASGTYTGTITVSTKDTEAGSYVLLNTYTGASASVPVDASTFPVAGTRYYEIKATQGGVTETLTTKVTAQASSFFLKKTTGILSLTTSGQGGFLLTTGASATAAAATAQLVVNGGSLTIKGGAAVTGTGKSIDFVPSTVAAYDANDAAAAKTAYAAGTPTATADVSTGTGVYVYRMQLGTNASDVYYGYIKINTVTPGTSVAFEYRIGDQYAHLAVIK